MLSSLHETWKDSPTNGVSCKIKTALAFEPPGRTSGWIYTVRRYDCFDELVLSTGSHRISQEYVSIDKDIAAAASIMTTTATELFRLDSA